MQADSSGPRVLIVDDNASIHDDFKKILGRGSVEEPEAAGDYEDLEAELFGSEASTTAPCAPSSNGWFELSHAHQGKEALELVEEAVEQSRPFVVAFVDMRMPPGWDGLKTIEKCWDADPDLEVVICSAYSDSTWEEMIERLGRTDRLIILKKPFEVVEVLQLATALSEKWLLRKAARRTVHELEEAVAARTGELKNALDRLQKETTERQRREAELREAHKLEAIGRIAGGVAHEINTPLQFIGDSLNFLQDSFRDLSSLIGRYSELASAAQDADLLKPHIARIQEAEQDADVAFLKEELPGAFERTSAGMNRVSTIVQALRTFADTDPSELEPIDLNRVLNDSVAVAVGEYGRVAIIKTHLDELPQVRCYPQEISQVFVSLLTNASHAIEDRGGSPASKGNITVRSRLENEEIVVEVEDDGCGIKEEHYEKVFDPFFTTKDVGRGSGQGLAVARNVVERLGGTIRFESVANSGSTFQIRLPRVA